MSAKKHSGDIRERIKLVVTTIVEQMRLCVKELLIRVDIIVFFLLVRTGVAWKLRLRHERGEVVYTLTIAVKRMASRDTLGDGDPCRLHKSVIKSTIVDLAKYLSCHVELPKAQFEFLSHVRLLSFNRV
ncbi:hypothetical protein N0V86_003186 [Didymella sp. IMI 355093]|nr:hypothetical protein N0V86_003186 [Didymella sp. IMI 355093]